VSIGQRVANAVLKIPKEKWATAAKLTVAVLAAALIDAYEYDFRSGEMPCTSCVPSRIANSLAASVYVRLAGRRRIDLSRPGGAVGGGGCVFNVGQGR